VVIKETVTDEVTPTVDEFTARAAIELLENRAFIKTFERLRTSALSDITHSQPGLSHAHVREAAHARIVALDAIQAELQSMADELKLHKKTPDPDNE
jgi:hypothetical protein